MSKLIKSKFLGSIKRVEYNLYNRCYWGDVIDTHIQKDVVHVKDVVFYECELNQPLLEVGESFLIEDESGYFYEIKITKRLRNNKNEMVYYTDKVVKLIHDELSMETLEYAQIEKLLEDKERKRMVILENLQDSEEKLEN